MNGRGRIVSVILAVMMLTGLCSCSNGNGTTDSGSSLNNSVETEQKLSLDEPEGLSTFDDGSGGSTNVMYTTAIVNVYAGKSVDSSMIDDLPPGTAVSVIRKETKWSSIRLNGKTCYVLSVYLKEEKPGTDRKTAEAEKEESREDKQAGSEPAGSRSGQKEETAVIDAGRQVPADPGQ
ncbi:MAG: hypothetical protein IKD86_03780 [Firmicutes bacterium]|nr:hypothetical protein [Bacillota bacterium]